MDHGEALITQCAMVFFALDDMGKVIATWYDVVIDQ